MTSNIFDKRRRYTDDVITRLQESLEHELGERRDTVIGEHAVAAANEAAELPPLDGEGKYLEQVEADRLLDLLGDPDDDGLGMLTKRMLLILESRVLLGKSAYDGLVERVIDAYWQMKTSIRTTICLSSW